MRSIRWRLPASYAVVALVAVISLGFILQTTLRDYYEKQELRHLHENARGVSYALSRYYENQSPDRSLEGQLKNLSFLAQIRIRLLDTHGEVIADSGSPNERTMISIGVPPSEDTAFFYEGSADTPIALPAQASITLFNVPPEQQDTMILSPTERKDEIAFGVAGTPFGFGFNRRDNIEWEGRSEQKVQAAVILNDSTLIGYVELSEGPAYGTRIVNNVEQNLIRAGVVAVALAFLVGLFVSYQIST
ncbi:MAG: cell wall metabolism sensor histidine kinase WalK, partial [Anaerolineae bacterium]|nr:cell wall metabolism sensor histidine kinase WalK [Anaerolineae bacterium]